MDLFRYLMVKNGHNYLKEDDLFSYKLAKGQGGGTYATFTGTSLSIDNTMGGRMKITLNGNTSQEGTPTPDSPQQVHVVSGDNTIKVEGKNLWGEEEHGGIDESTGQNISNASRWRTINYIKATPNTSYTLSSNASSNIWYIFYYYDKNKNFISSKPLIGTASVTWTSPNNCEYIRAVVGDTSSIQTTERQLEVGNTATTYEPYTSTSYPIHLGGELFDYAYQVEKQYNSSGTQQNTQRYTLSNNVITISRDKSNYGRYFMNKKQLIAGDYILKFTPTLSGSDNRISFSIMDLDTQVEYEEETITITNGTEITKTFTLDTSANISINIQPYKDTSGTLTFTNVSLKSTMQEIELCKIGDYKDRFLRNSGKNKCDITSATAWGYVSGLPTSEVSNLVIDNFDSNNITYHNYNSIAGYYYVLTNVIQLKPSTQYTIKFSRTSTSTNNQFFIYDYDNGTYTINFRDNNENILEKTFTTNNLGQVIFGFGHGNTAGTTTISNIMLNEGSTALSYEPYGTNEWYLEKKIGKYVYTANDFTIASNDSYSNVTYAQFKKTEDNIQYGAYLYGDLIPYFSKGKDLGGVPAGNWNSYIQDGYIYNYAMINNYWMSFAKGTSLAYMREKLDGMISYYILATPTYTPITGTLKDELEAVWRASSYKGTTNISQVNDDESANLEVTVRVSE